MRSVMSHQFSKVPSAQIERASFNRDHGHKTTFNAGFLVPVFLDEALPGDTFNLKMTAFARLATPIKPLMDNMFLDSFFFAVPYRLVWDNWQRFNGEQTDPGDPTDFTIPTMTAPDHAGGGIVVGSLSDYFGLPTGPLGVGNTGLVFNSLHHRAYNLIYNEWFRDQNLQDSVVVDRDDGPDNYADYTLLRRGKRHDYFTSCLPWPQKGPDVLLPLGGSAPITGTLDDNGTIGEDIDFRTGASGGGASIDLSQVSNLSPLFPAIQGDPTITGGTPIFGYYPGQASIPLNISGIVADLSTATAATINSIREAFQLQKMYERDARGGTRYTEIIHAHFSVISPDARLQRPEYLGGGSTPINIHPIAQTSATPSSPTVKDAQGNLAAFGTASASNHGFTKSFTEHCLIIGLISVRADLTYQTGLNRMFSRQTRFDFFWPALAHLGEQAVLNKEIYAQGPGVSGTPDEEVFGYQERFAEYRYKPSLITGQFRSSFAQSLDYWHLSQDFGSLPVLDDTFIVENPPVDRVVAVTTGAGAPQFFFDSFFKFQSARPMPIFSVPGMVDHF